MSHQDDDFLQQIRSGLDRGVDELDGDTINRLRQGRVQALERNSRRYSSTRWLLAGGALASVSLVVVLNLHIGHKPVQQSMLEDMALLSTDAHLQLYQDLDFYEWLAQREKHGGV